MAVDFTKAGRDMPDSKTQTASRERVEQSPSPATVTATCSPCAFLVPPERSNLFESDWSKPVAYLCDSYHKTSQGHRAQLIQHPLADCVATPRVEKVLTSDPDLLYRMNSLLPDELGTNAIPVVREAGTWRHVEMGAPSLGCFPVAVIHEVRTKQGLDSAVRSENHPSQDR
jgi:hypothetical protein